MMTEELTLGEVHRMCLDNKRRIDELQAQIAAAALSEWKERKDERHSFRNEMAAITTRIEVGQQSMSTDLTAKVASIITRLDMIQQMGGKSIGIAATVAMMAISNIATGVVVYQLTRR